MESPENKDSHIIQALSKVHYDTQTGNYSGKTISPQLIRALWLIALFILLIACVNFINLSTAQAVNRAKEVGVRKVLGSSKWQLKTQFIVETFLIVITAVLLSTIIALAALSPISKILNISLSFDILHNPSIILFLCIVAIVVTVLAGFYPSIVLSRFSIGTSKLNYLRKELKDINGIQSVSFSSNTPVEDDNDNWTTFKFDHSIKETDFYAINKWTDNEFLPTYHLPLVAGRNLQASDTAREFLVNEILIKNLGIKNPQDALNKEINLWDGQIKGNIVGVLKDYNDRSFRRDLAPVLMTTMKRGYSIAGIKLEMQSASGILKEIEKTWNQTFPDYVFEYKFLDAKIEDFYKRENQLSQLYKIFAIIAIFLSCLGLYGLASFMAVQRIKEVGIRKVLGASAGNIVYLFSREFIVLIAIAFVIASPLAWYFMHRWLQDYVYRINISWWIFGIGGAISIFIALATVSFQAIKAAIANPVKSLRTE
jgi:putative ABC transport system permease protein